MNRPISVAAHDCFFRRGVAELTIELATEEGGSEPAVLGVRAGSAARP
jgi:hypothetical protein